MSGRHRKPSTTGKTVAKVAVTGAIMTTAGLAFSGTANAAPDSDWDKLAQCEAGGNWGINTGNGFQGGLQFSPSTWTSHGGGEYAATANQASREEQITVAERVLGSQGWGAWPSCSSKLGLSSSPTERETPSTPAVPALPDLASIGQGAQDSNAAAIQGITDAVKAVTADPNIVNFIQSATQNLQLDPQLVGFYEANKNLLPR
ncbi:hypothetical protein GCM10007304_40460 [Rhodococcoides trifolii]|uniref:Resuscitation-promoting factor core lysozyme-like domain-containing protein n=1 Tax=Rhodococcoides trifolii TaxID=908250 RepID=A0A917LH19_9NOCA|nr:transglycosylase family protein [Rhodococcus trifolii]GGG22539.1 hypothetical protein GCM10007304_40460 [Rhodococcus trifolii]